MIEWEDTEDMTKTTAAAKKETTKTRKHKTKKKRSEADNRLRPTTPSWWERQPRHES